MPWLRVAFLITVLALTSGYRFRCYFFCTDQTSTQNDYVERRDHCREFAQLKVDMAMREASMNGDDKGRKSQLVTLFSQCMASNGWVVPDGRGEGTGKPQPQPLPGTTLPPPASLAAQSGTAPAIVAAPVQVTEKSSTTRAAECAFARQSRDVSSNAEARADACDLECAEGLKTAPDAPRPAACAPDMPSKLSRGNEE